MAFEPGMAKRAGAGARVASAEGISQIWSRIRTRQNILCTRSWSQETFPNREPMLEPRKVLPGGKDLNPEPDPQLPEPDDFP